MAKGLKLKVRMFLGLISTFVEVTGEKLVGAGRSLPPILNKVKYNHRSILHLQFLSSWILNCQKAIDANVT